MDDLGDPESAAHAPATFHCLICAQEDKDNNESPIIIGGLIEGPEESQNIFNLLCNSLKIKLNKKNSWDFQKESLPFCPSCLEISRELVEIQAQIRLLEKQYAGKVQEIRNLIVGSEKSTELGNSGERNDGEDDTDGRQSDHRFGYFRDQVTGTRTRGRKEIGRKCRKQLPSSNITSVPQIKLKKLTSLLEEPKKSRRSERVSKKILAIIPDFHSSEDEDDVKHDNDTLQDSPNNEIAFDPFSHSEDNQEHVYMNYDSPDALDIKPLIDIKQEECEPELGEKLEEVCEPLMIIQSEYEHQQPLNSSSLSLSILAPTSKGSINKRTSKQTQSRLAVKEKQIKQSVVDIESENSEFEYDSDYTKEKSENSSASDEEMDTFDDKGRKTSGPGTRKWKSCKKTGRFWYDGIEILPTPDGLKCTECDEVVKGEKNWKNKSGMKRHILSKHMEKFSCELCDKTLSSQKYLNLHIKAVHEKSILIPCDVCEKPFTSVNAMRRHKWDHQSEEEKKTAIAAGKRKYGSGSKNKGEILQCTKCGKMCKGPFSLKQHEETHFEESQRRKHMCQVCGGLYSNQSCLKSHIRRQHENNNRLQWLQCPHCPKKYPTRSQLQLHVRFHTGEKPFKCQECSAGFNTTRLLKNHMLKHKNIRPHKCQDCDMSFYQRYHLRRHREVYHESANPPTRKQPYRSEIGTRKPPQKRTKKTGQSQNQQTIIKPDNAPLTNSPHNQYQTSLAQHHREHPHQPVSGSFDVQQQFFGSVGNMSGMVSHAETFGFNNPAYPFDYSLTGRGLNQ